MFMHGPSLAPSDNPISADLLRAWDRSEHKPADWTLADASRALRRYERFLHLVAAHPGMPQAPTRDIDEMWHLHMLSPAAYQRDCLRLFGCVLDHDGGFGKGEGEAAQLQAVFDQTAHMWQQMYGEPYVSTPAEASTKCWHDCVGRCWHACSTKPAATDPLAA